MKKKLEAELISIAHKVLQLKNKNDIRLLHQEAQKLYEKLSVLLFIEENFKDPQPTLDFREIEEKIETIFSESTDIQIQDKTEIGSPTPEKNTPTAQTTTITETMTSQEIVKDTESFIDTPSLDSFVHITQLQNTQNTESPNPVITDLTAGTLPKEPIFERIGDKKVQETINSVTQIDFPPLTSEPIFERVNPSTIPTPKTPPTTIKVETQIAEQKTHSLNDTLNKTAQLSLNDKIAFAQHLFDGSTEDLNRVLSQIVTFTTFNDAKDFIDQIVKPDYNNWYGKEDFATRFLEIIESKFI